MRQSVILALAFVGIITVSSLQAAEEPVFSGPQVGEELVPFEALGVLGELAGKKIDVVRGDDKDKPVLLIFVHRLTRPSIGLLRTIANFANSQKKNPIETGIVFLSDDPTDMEARIRRAQHALPKHAPPLISPDGVEGPGAYGLNRKMTLTVLVGDKGKVQANFPLIQPSVQADALKIAHAIVKATGGTKKPTEEDLRKHMPAMGRRQPEMESSQQAMDGTLRGLMRPLLQAKTKDEVDKAAKAVEKMAAGNKQFKARVAGAAGRIVKSGRLKTYGTAHAQEYIKKWAKEFASAPDKRKKATSKKKSNEDAGSKDES